MTPGATAILDRASVRDSRWGVPALKEHDPMTRSILCGLLALLSVGAMGILPLACQSGGVGDPCTPEDEYNTEFPGFKVTEENIESRSFQCQTRICLVNHFQGRVSCPAGQPPPKGCNGPNDTTSCSGSEKCVLSETYAPACTPCTAGDPTCLDTCQAAGFKEACNGTFGYCGCTTADNHASSSNASVTFQCESATGCTTAGCPNVLNSYVCHKPAGTESFCQTAGDTVATGKGKDCCVPGTDNPLSVSVCGQCDATSDRNAEQAVYCTCRCCAPCCPPCSDPSKGLCLPMGDDPTNPSCSTDTSICGPACDSNFNYCSCPGGYACVGIRTNVGLGDAELAGAYCIKSGTAYVSTATGTCGAAALGGYVGDTSCSD
jgi:hypothetical protein